MSSIAIYEEDQQMRALLLEWLRSAGYQVKLETPPASEPADEVDLAIVSICRPKQPGDRLLQEVQAAYPGTPVIALSGQFRGGLASCGATARSLGVAQVIAKPLPREVLLQAVRAMIGPPG